MFILVLFFLKIKNTTSIIVIIKIVINNNPDNIANDLSILGPKNHCGVIIMRKQHKYTEYRIIGAIYLIFMYFNITNYAF